MKLVKNLEAALKDSLNTRFLKLKIKSNIPQELEALSNLEELYLECDFTLCEFDFSLLPNLKLMSINSNNLEFFPHQALRSLSLTNLKIISGTFSRIELPLEILSPLTSLTLKNTKLSSLPLEFGQLNRLQELNLSHNDLKDLPPSFGDLTNLSRLNIDNNQFERLSDVINKCSSLKHLSCDGNPFPEEEKYRIQRVFNIY